MQFTHMFLKIIAVLDMMPRGLLNKYLSTSLYGLTFQNTAIFNVTAMRTTNLTQMFFPPPEWYHKYHLLV